MNESLKAARKNKLLTQTEVAKMVKVSPMTVSKWERGLTKPRKDRGERLCRLLEKSAEELGL